MTDSNHPTHRSRRDRSRRMPRVQAHTSTTATPSQQPDPLGDVVPGDPPVPITVWHLPRPPKGTPVSPAMVRRLVVNYTRPGAAVLDLTANGQLAPTGPRSVGLVIIGWPVGRHTATEHLAACATVLQPGGCLAVVLTTTCTPDHLGPLVAAGRAAGLTYLQHIVVAHQLTPRPTTPAAEQPQDRSGDGQTGEGTPHLRVHTDVLIMRAATGAAHA